MAGTAVLVRIQGIVESRSEYTPVSNWLGPGLWEGRQIVGRRVVLVTAETEIRGPPRLGMPAHVVALRYPWRPLVAVRIDVLSVAPVEPLETVPKCTAALPRVALSARN